MKSWIGESSPSDSNCYREMAVDNYRLQIDMTRQVLAIELPEEREYGDFDSVDGSRSSRVEPTLLPTLKEVASESFISAAMLAQKAKQVDDRIYASVEIALQKGAGDFAGKEFLLKTVAQSSESIPAEFYAAAELGGILDQASPPFDQDVARQVALIKKNFLSNQNNSKPIGFYTWNDPLIKIFQQDRLLQSRLDHVSGLVRELRNNSPARQAYESYLEFVARLTNPLVEEPLDLRALLEQLDRLTEEFGADVHIPKRHAFFPPSVSHETELIKKLFNFSPIPDGFSLSEEMIVRIQNGKLSVVPTKKSGWYDFQTWSLEPMVVPEKMPESVRLTMDDGYRDHLLKLFTGILTLTRETHIKQLEVPTCAMAGRSFEEKPTVEIAPRLSLEPTYSYYLRRAVSYRFLQHYLEQHFGPEHLSSIPIISVDGTLDQNLKEALSEIVSLFFGAAIVLARELGNLNPVTDIENMVGQLDVENEILLPVVPAGEEDRCAEDFLFWMRKQEDRDVFADSRAMVPVFFDELRQQTKCWVFLGWTMRPMEISYVRRPEVSVFGSTGQIANSQVQLVFTRSSQLIASPVMAEVYVDRLMDRNEFRKICDQHRKASLILKRLEMESSPAAKGVPLACLVVSEPEGPPRNSFRRWERWLEHESTRIGRQPDVEISLKCRLVSSIHAEISVDDTGHVITDRGSTNGTFVNGEKLTGPKRLQVNDVIQIGRCKMVYQWLGQSAFRPDD